jgi:hypothetical protein
VSDLQIRFGSHHLLALLVCKEQIRVRRSLFFLTLVGGFSSLLGDWSSGVDLLLGRVHDHGWTGQIRLHAGRDLVAAALVRQVEQARNLPQQVHVVGIFLQAHVGRRAHLRRRPS